MLINFFFFLLVISNANYELIFDEESRLLASIKDKRNGLTKEVKVKFGGYPTGKNMPLKIGPVRAKFRETD